VRHTHNPCTVFVRRDIITSYPDGTVCTALFNYNGSTIIIKSNIRHHELENFKCHFLQSMSIEFEA